jgi:hypothetical protein
MCSLFQDIPLDSPTYLDLDAMLGRRDKTEPKPQAPPSAEVSAESSSVPSGEQTLPKDKANVATSGPTHLKPGASLLGALKGQVERLQPLIRGGDSESKPSYKPSHTDTEVCRHVFRQSFMVEEAHTVNRDAMSTRKTSLELLLGIDSLHMSTLKIKLSPTTHGNSTRVSHARRSPKSPKSASHRAAAKVIFTGPLVDDVSALGDENLLAHNPESFAL